MGEVSETAMTMMTEKKKKKGRPSLLDLQMRSLKEQQLQRRTNPNSLNLTSNLGSRSARRKPNLDAASPAQDWIAGDDDDERKEKKHKLLLGFNSNPNSHYPTLPLNSLSFNTVPNGSDSNANGEDPEVALKIRNNPAAAHHNEREKVSKATDSRIHGSQVESGPTTPLPDKKLLVFILDRLQKKDSYGVFSEPVDPEELPDYHDIIENPMDFGTVRKKLDQGAYACLEHIEKDVNLICTNAMQYNAPDTIYFRQARSIQELARKDFENVRQNGNDCQLQPKKRGRPPGKSVKRSIDRSPVECGGLESLSDTTLASGSENANWSNTYNLRKAPIPCKLRPADALNGISHGSLNGETCNSWSTEWENEFPASVLRSVQKYGKKQFAVDENRRDTYRQSFGCGDGQMILDALEGEWKELMPVGPHLEHCYARSLARFAAGLGPAVWKIASERIGIVLPIGLKFGPGWIGENEVTRQQESLFCEKSFSDPVSNDHTSRLLSPSASVSNSVAGNRCFLQNREDPDSNIHNETASLDCIIGSRIAVRPFADQRDSIIGCGGVNGLNSGNVGYVPPQKAMLKPSTLIGKSTSADTPMPSQMLGTVSLSNTTIFSVPVNDTDSNEANLANRYLGNLLPLDHRQVFYQLPSDLNVRFQAPGSPSSIVQIGSPQQPDLALQL
ncbi:hypothetical protein FNV43_RR12085 [Rhamnella rubrinervis]|uniref:Bromo domain-containing protein n=1 Tax=Rhamnella rubrinervis TaxID=2594499 RepID=A0A8K0H729_9ROSA|nr:hypothetical protein FNV43_RR12085 [Rhamnella rubrinervis]